MKQKGIQNGNEIWERKYDEVLRVYNKGVRSSQFSQFSTTK